jgi:hypothetical protein
MTMPKVWRSQDQLTRQIMLRRLSLTDVIQKNKQSWANASDRPKLTVSEIAAAIAFVYHLKPAPSLLHHRTQILRSSEK